MVGLFAATLFLSSSLLFIVQPMIAKMVLPLLGGTPAVWNTCMVFFQGVLLAGYLYAHAASRWLRVQHQAILHITLLLVSFLTLPVIVAAQTAEPPTTGMPIGWLLRVLVTTVGLPFFLVSSSGPLLQRWFARTNHRLASDPYFLSVAGNVGSIAALLSYPVLFERSLRLAEQSSLWTIGYAGLVALTAACFAFAYRQTSAHGSAEIAENEAMVGDQPAWSERLRWVMLSFVPSSLLLGVTTFMTTDVAAVPLLWIVPLVLYLLTFVLVFARRTIVPHTAMVRALAFWVLPLTWLIVFDTPLPVVVEAPLHLLAFFFAAMVCHGELARRRPSATYLTEFYLSMSVGGVLGGLFNALVAPLVFSTVVEYPLVLVLACALRPSGASADSSKIRGLDVALPAAIGAFAFAMLMLFDPAESRAPLTLMLVIGIPTLACLRFSPRPVRFALGVAALMIAGATYLAAQEQVTHRGRSFFGVHRVFDDTDDKLRYLVHGGIIHGAQHLEESRRREPSMYYHKDGPIGQVFSALSGRIDKRRIAVIGLGIGGLAAYSESHQRWTFYEIDPAIADLAQDPRQFTYISDSPADVRIVLGDARIALQKAPRRGYDVFVVDAFSSDAIPVHLLTREALRLYWEKLDEGGILAFHISNTYLNLAPLVADLARDSGLFCVVRFDTQGAASMKDGKGASQWAVMARSPQHLEFLGNDPRWQLVPARATSTTWTDDFSDPLSLMKWFGK
jgi:spermidine synthase